MANEKEKCREVWKTLQENPSWGKHQAYEYLGYEDTSDTYCFACDVANNIQDELDSKGIQHEDCCFGCPIKLWPDKDGNYIYDYCGSVDGGNTAYEFWVVAESDEDRAYYAGLMVKTVDDQWIDNHKQLNGSERELASGLPHKELVVGSNPSATTNSGADSTMASAPDS